LARAGDNAALPILIDIAQDPQSQWREYVYTSLASFEDDPVAEKAIRAGLKDRDQRVREEAERALKQINRNREQKRQDNSQQSDPR
jgi:HEAT repeat protein